MNLGIFFDAVAVAGRADLLGAAKSALIGMMRAEQALLARFAHLIETFDTPALGVLSAFMASVGVGSDEIDIKKAGTFPIVHGVRTLALDRGVSATPTAARIGALVEAGALAPEIGGELVGALRVFMGYRLRSQLEAVRRGDVEREAVVRPSHLSAADRDILRDALRIVRRFRDTIRNRYSLGAF
jgi:CBS domain-containing protein